MPATRRKVQGDPSAEVARVVALRRPGIAATDLEQVPTAIVQIASVEEPPDGAPDRLDALGRRGSGP